jgi:hypothetical protein
MWSFPGNVELFSCFDDFDQVNLANRIISRWKFVILKFQRALLVLLSDSIEILIVIASSFVRVMASLSGN